MSKEAINDIGVRVAPTVHLGALIGWLALAAFLLAGCALPFGLPSPPAEEPVITAQVRSSENGLQITVAGQRWSVGKEILINLRSPDRTLEGTFAATQPGADGQFTITFAYPSEPAWQALSSVVVIARSSDGQQQASTILLIPAISATPTATQTVTTTVALTAPVTPGTTPAATTLPAPSGQTPAGQTATGTPGPTPDARLSRSVDTRVNVRAGPSTAYPILTTVDPSTSLLVLGQNAAGDWLYIRLDNGLEGWIARSLTAYIALATVVATPPPPPTATPLPATATPQPTPVITDWRGEYYNNDSFAGSPALIRNDRDIDFNWGRSAPAPGLPADHFSIRWTRSLEFRRGQYRFTARVDDGLRLFVDGNLLINEWRTGGARDVVVETGLLDGVHSLRVEYFENEGDAVAQLRWERVADEASFPDWRGEYWANPNLQGSPAVVRNDQAVDFVWGTGAPAAGLPVDNFSARWTRLVDFPEATYRFHARVDDGVRVLIDNTRIIDQWHDHEADEVYTADIQLGGRHQVTVEYYERSGGAGIDFWWDQPAATATPTAPPTNTSAPAATNTPVPTATNTPPPAATSSPAAERLTIRLQPDSGAVGSEVTVSGQNFPADARVGIYLATSGQRQERQRIGSGRSDENGNFRTTVEIPTRGPDGKRLRPGPLEVLAIPAGGGMRAIARFTVEPGND